MNIFTYTTKQVVKFELQFLLFCQLLIWKSKFAFQIKILQFIFTVF